MKQSSDHRSGINEGMTEDRGSAVGRIKRDLTALDKIDSIWDRFFDVSSAVLGICMNTIRPDYLAG